MDEVAQLSGASNEVRDNVLHVLRALVTSPQVQAIVAVGPYSILTLSTTPVNGLGSWIVSLPYMMPPFNAQHVRYLLDQYSRGR